MASQYVTDVGDASFQKEVLEADKPVLVDFWATWCGPCRAIAPTVEELAKTFSGQLKVVKFDVQSEQATAQRYGITAIPTLLFFKGGKVVQSLVGSVSKTKLEEAIRNVVG